MTRLRNIVQGLRSPGFFARFPAFGLAAFLLGSVAFGLLAYNLRTNDGLLQWDMGVAGAFRFAQINAPWSRMEDVLFGGFVGKEVVILIGTVLAVYFLHKRLWRELSMVLAGLGGGAMIWYFLSRYFDRPRPPDQLEVLQLSGPSFPSAPALMAVICYGLLAYLLIPNLPSIFWRWFTGVMCALAVGTVGLSSLLFGAHYATDVLSGYALGLAWAGLAFTLSEVFIQGQAPGEQKILDTAAAFGGLRSPGFLGRQPLVGLVLILLSGLGLAAMGYSLIFKGPLIQLDMSVYKWLLSRARVAPPVMNDLMLFGFFVGKQAVQLIVAVLSLYFLYQRYWRELAMIQISAQGGGVIWNSLIDFFSRPRPPEQLGLATSAIPSFPSGHALGTMIGYGFLAYLLVPRMPSPFWKWTTGIAILLLILFEGFSRIFHGNHYLTDVLAGYALGIAWLVLVCTLIESILMGRQS